MRQQFLQAAWYRCPDAGFDLPVISLILHSRKDHQQTESAQHKRKTHGIREDIVSEIAQIAEDTPRTEKQEGSPPEQSRNQHEPDVDEAVAELCQLTPAFHQREPSPERQHPEEIAPKGEVLFGAPVHKKRGQQYHQPKTPAKPTGGPSR